MPRQIRDLVVTMAALFVIFIMLISVNPRLRESAGQLTGGISGQDWDASRSALTHTMLSVSAVVSGYAADNPYMVVFLVAACVLFVLMLRT